MKNNPLNMEKIIRKFHKSEESHLHRKDPLKIDMPFEKALKTILKAKPENKQEKRRKEQQFEDN